MTKQSKRPRGFAEWLLARLLLKEEREEKLGDFEEIFRYKAEDNSILKAKFWYWQQIIKAIPTFISNSIYWSLAMFKNYLKISLRNILKQKGFSFITISGLAVGIVCFIFIFLYVTHELSFDKYHKDADRIYRITQEVRTKTSTNIYAKAAAPLIAALKDQFPEVESAVRILQPWWRNTVKYKNKAFLEDNLILADNDIFKVFTIPLLQGNPETALSRGGTIVISERMAGKYFAGENPIGKTLRINDDYSEITGVFENIRDNSHLKFDLVKSLKSVEERWDLSNWGWLLFYSYIKLAANVNAEAFENKIRYFANNYIKEKLKEWGGAITYFLQPITDIHLYSNLRQEFAAVGNPLNIYMFSIIAVMILLIVCINFINLSTARSANRAKEVGMRKVVGAERSQLISQFLAESVIMAFLAFFAAILVVYLTLPVVNDLTGKNFGLADLFRINTIFTMIGLTIFVGIAAGSYPAFYLSLLKTPNVFNRLKNLGLKRTTLRKLLVMGQFSISIVLIIGTFVIFRQIHYMKHKDLGFEKEQKLIIPANFDNNFFSVKREFLAHPLITGVSFSWSVPGRLSDCYSVKIIGHEDDTNQSMNFHYFDYDFIPQYKIKMAAGRPFKKDISTDVRYAFVINEAAAEALGFRSPGEALGKRMYEGGSGDIGKIIGVTKDFFYKGVQSVVEPLVMQMKPGRYEMINLTVKTGNLDKTLSFIEKKWYELHLGDTFRYFFLDEDFNLLYGSEEKMGKLFTTFTFLAIFISCLGLFGLASFTAEQRTKEIGIRKVLGSSIPGIVLLLSKDFSKWVLAANVFAWPVAYIAVNRWLQSFAHKTSIGIDTFILSGLLVLIISLVTVSYQSIKAAAANPVDALKYE